MDIAGAAGTDRIRVLHVDDDRQLTKLAATYLEREEDRFVVETATNVGDGLEHLAEAEVDCIVSDLEMPDRNGIEFLEAVREDHPDLPFILYTGNGSEAVASDAISAGVTDYLRKNPGAEQYALLANRIGNFVEQYRSKRALEASQKRLSLFIEQSPLGVLEYNEDFEIVRINDAAEEILGYSEAELRGHTWEKLVTENSYDNVDAVTDELAAARGGYHSIDENRRKDGERIVCEWHNRIVTDDRGEVVAVFSQFQDITDRKTRERELQRTNALLSTLIETLPVGVLVEDQARTVLTVNERLVDLFGLSRTPDELLGADCDRIAAAVSDLFSNSSAFEGRIEELIAAEEPGEDDVLALRDGRTFSRSYRPIELPSGTGHLWMYRDITDQRERERRLSRYSETLERLQRTTQRLLEATDMDDALELVLRSIEDVLDFDVVGIWRATESGDRLEPVSITEAGKEDVPDAPTYSPASESLSWRAFEQNELRVVSDLHAHDERHNPDTPLRSEIIVPLEGYGVINIGSFEPDAFSDQDRTLVELWADTVTTAFARIEREQELHKREHELVRERDRLDEFASIVSHDLRNPLNVAQGWLDIVREDCDDPHLKDIAQAHDRMNALVDDLLTLARDGDVVSETEVVDLAGLVDSCWRHVETADARIHTDVDRRVRADRSRLAQLLENLLRNAVEHGDGSPEITVGELDGGFYVADDGPGIPEDEREAVFDPGYSTSGSGTGFGLSIVRQVAEAHGWSVRVTDGPDGGARFEITGVEFVG